MWACPSVPTRSPPAGPPPPRASTAAAFMGRRRRGLHLLLHPPAASSSPWSPPAASSSLEARPAVSSVPWSPLPPTAPAPWSSPLLAYPRRAAGELTGTLSTGCFVVAAVGCSCPAAVYASAPRRSTLPTATGVVALADPTRGQRWACEAEPHGATKTWLRLPFESREGLRQQLHSWSRCKIYRLAEPLEEPCQTGPRFEPLRLLKKANVALLK
jgi:hypothetical protein